MTIEAEMRCNMCQEHEGCIEVRSIGEEEGIRLRVVKITIPYTDSKCDVCTGVNGYQHAVCRRKLIPGFP